MDELEKLESKNETLMLDSLADLHERCSKLESRDVQLSRRITTLEESKRGHYSDDPISGFLSPSMIIMIAVVSILPIVVDVWKQWRLSSSQSSV